ncbi:MAG: GDP-mannose 4,6-dehydratase [Acidobacteriota bacterium]
MPRALITGIGGFVGPYLAALLHSHAIDCVGISQKTQAHDHPVGLVDTPVHEIDLRDRGGVEELVAREKPDLVFHLAAMSHVATSRTDPVTTFDTNVGGTLNLLEAVRRRNSGCRVLFVSTGNMYGDIESPNEGFSESDPVHPGSPYASSKFIGEQLARCYYEDFGVEVVIARPFNHTGPGQSPSFACPEFARAIAEGVVHRTGIHLRTGPLEPHRDISDVRDVVRAYALLAERGKPGEVYNVCSGSMVQMESIVARLAAIAGVSVTTELDPAKLRRREILYSGGNPARIRSDLGWAPRISLERTLTDLLEYWVDRLSRADKAGSAN